MPTVQNENVLTFKVLINVINHIQGIIHIFIITFSDITGAEAKPYKSK